MGQFDLTLANANAGGHPGATQYASTCSCQFYQPSYPYAIGPRIGVAYQIDPKTVLRGGWGVVYTEVFGTAGGIVSTNGTYACDRQQPSYIPAAAQFVNIETPGSIATPALPVTDPNRYPVLGTVGGQPAVMCPTRTKTGRHAQTNSASASSARLPGISSWRRPTWATASPGCAGGRLGNLSRISPQQYAAYGLYPYPGTGPCSTGGGVCASTTYNNNNDRNLLTQSISSTAVIQNEAAHGITNLLPYPGFPPAARCRASFTPSRSSGCLTPRDPRPVIPSTTLYK